MSAATCNSWQGVCADGTSDSACNQLERALQGVRKPAAAECRGLLEVRAFEHGKELLDTIRARTVIVASNVERFVVEVGTKFIARPEERLLNVVHTLLLRCYRLPLPQGADVPDYMRTELKSVCDACLSQEMQVRLSMHARVLHGGT